MMEKEGNSHVQKMVTKKNALVRDMTFFMFSVLESQLLLKK